MTAGNSSGQNDGASACLVTTAEYALRPLARLRSWAVAGVGPEVMGIGPVPATAGALGRVGLSLADTDLAIPGHHQPRTSRNLNSRALSYAAESDLQQAQNPLQEGTSASHKPGTTRKIVSPGWRYS